MVEYGNAVGQGAQVAGGGSGTGGGAGSDVTSSIAASLTGALDHASAALGVPPSVLLAVAVAILLFVLYLRFAR